MTPSTRELFEETAAFFLLHVPNAIRDASSGQFAINVDDIPGTVRLKRGKEQINQNHIIHGEPLVVHIPPEEGAEGDGSWAVLPLSWLIEHCLLNPGSKQHTIHALECFMFSSGAIPVALYVEPGNLSASIDEAIQESRSPEIRRAIRFVERAHTFALTHFQETADLVALGMGITIP